LSGPLKAKFACLFEARVVCY